MMIDLDIRKQLHGADGAFDLKLALQVKAGELLAIYGPSGVGKTTLLRIIAGLERPDTGHLQVDGETWYDQASKVNVHARKRAAGLVFQDYALFPNMSVQANIAFAQDRRRRDPALISALLDLTGLSALADRRPAQLSGGQAQRVALARAIAAQPRILLLDEALSALDPAMRRQMQAAVAAIHSEFSLTTLLVSHDLSEVFLLADRVLLLEKGQQIKLGTPAEVFPPGEGSKGLRLIGKILSLNAQEAQITTEVQGQILEMSAPAIAEMQVGDRVYIEISPEGGAMKASPMRN